MRINNLGFLVSMKNIIIFLFTLCFFSFSTEAQVVNMGGASMGQEEGKQGSFSYGRIVKETVRLLTIGIGSFSDSDFDQLNSFKTLDDFRKVSKDYLPLSYKNHPEPVFLNRANVKAEDVRRALTNLVETTTQNDLVIVSILSHGEVYQDEYFLICSDSNNDDYYGTAIPGSELRGYFEQMANAGAVVAVFLDTCHASALFDKSSFSPKSNGAIAYYASSRRDQSAKEINETCRFTSSVIDVFLNKTEHAFNDYGFVSLKSLDAQIKAALSAITTENQQEPVSSFFTNYDLETFGDYPLIKKKELVPYGTIWEHPKPFSPLAVSPYKGRGLDYALIALEGLSVVGFISCGIIQEDCKSKIQDAKDNVELRNTYRERGKTAAMGCWISTGVFVASYALKTWHVHYQYQLQFREGQYASLDIMPSLSPSFGGLALLVSF